VEKLQVLPARAFDNSKDFRMSLQCHADGAAAVSEEQDDAMVAMDLKDAPDKPLMVEDGGVKGHAFLSTSVEDDGAKPVAATDGNDFGREEGLTEPLSQSEKSAKAAVLLGEVAQPHIFRL